MPKPDKTTTVGTQFVRGPSGEMMERPISMPAKESPLTFDTGIAKTVAEAIGSGIAPTLLTVAEHLGIPGESLAVSLNCLQADDRRKLEALGFKY